MLKEISIKRHNLINLLLYYMYVIVYCFVVVKFGLGTPEANVRYYFLFFMTIFALLTVLVNKFLLKKSKELKSKQLLLFGIVGLIFILVSFSKASALGLNISTRTYVQTSLFLLPALYSFAFVNIFNLKEICKIMMATSIIVTIMYFFQPDHYLYKFFIIDNWLKIDFARSVSFTESSEFSEVFLLLFLFFFYFKRFAVTKNQKKKMNFYWILNFVFTILSFKRMAILFSVLIILFDNILKYKKNHKFFNPIVFTSLFCIATVLYTKFMQGLIFTNIDVYKLTSGRDWILSLWANNNYISYGYGSSLLIIGRYLEMDLIQIYLELNLLCLFIFIYSMFKTANTKTYSNLIIIYSLFNMLTASSLPWTLGWILLLMITSCISSDRINNEKMFEGDSNDNNSKNYLQS